MATSDPRALTLEAIHPFRCLPPALRADLASALVEQRFGAGENVLRAGDRDDKRVWLLAEGRLETVDVRGGEPKHLGVLSAPRFLGERAALFEETRPFDVRALGPALCYSIGGARFLALLREDTAFAQALGQILREKRAIFAAFDRFRAEILRGMTRGDLALRPLLPLYRALEPALHPRLAEPTAIDWGALSYAVRRLPENVGRTLMYFLTDELPELYGALAPTFGAISTEVRPRTVYEMLPGKSIVILRDGTSDLVDLVTCLCLYAIEARKIRKRMRGPGAIDALSRLPDDIGSLAIACDVGGANAQCDDLGSLPFDALELERLSSIWPRDTLARVREIVLHHEDFGLEIKKQVHNYNSQHVERWSAEIASATRRLVGRDPTDLPDGMDVHVISSNTHSVSNCLSSYWQEHADAIHADTLRVRPEWRGAFAERMDLVYAGAREWLARGTSRAAERLERERGDGFLRLSETAFTGIHVDLIDLRRLAGRAIDPGLVASPRGRDALLVNVDFAFGQQAEEIIGNLIALFGRRIRSVNILGKAGSLVGRRGDLLVPSGFVEQLDDHLLELGARQRVDVARLRARLPAHAVHEGRMLTVAGTLLQNRLMLHFYRRIWDCVGLEMEGWFYGRKLVDALQLGMLRPDLELRFLYYVSDVPLEPESSLSERLGIAEGVPPLYAITREILAGILESAREVRATS